MKKLKAYVLGNLDGTNSCLVVASTISEAAEIMGASVYYMRQMGWRPGTPTDLETALAYRGIALYRPIDNNRGYFWSPVRWHRDYSKPGAGHYVPHTSQ